MMKMFPELFCSEVATQLWQRLTDLESSLMKEEATAAWAALAALAALAAVAALAAAGGPSIRKQSDEQLLLWPDRQTYFLSVARNLFMNPLAAVMAAKAEDFHGQKMFRFVEGLFSAFGQTCPDFVACGWL